MAYSLILNVTEQVRVENGSLPMERSLHGSKVFEEYFKSYFNIEKECGADIWGSIYLKDTGCFARGGYKKLGETENVKDENGNEIKLDMFYDIHGNARNHGANSGGYTADYYHKVLLKNGMSLGLATNVSDLLGYVWVVDIDGPNKGNSRLGQDVFMFSYKTSCENPLFFASSPFDGCESPTRKDLLANCSESAKGVYLYSVPGSMCGELIVKDGWKISKDYPWNYAQRPKD